MNAKRVACLAVCAPRSRTDSRDSGRELTRDQWRFRLWSSASNGAFNFGPEIVS
jgi:hypothetical protein